MLIFPLVEDFDDFKETETFRKFKSWFYTNMICCIALIATYMSLSFVADSFYMSIVIGHIWIAGSLFVSMKITGDYFGIIFGRMDTGVTEFKDIYKDKYKEEVDGTIYNDFAKKYKNTFNSIGVRLLLILYSYSDLHNSI